jgi:hypothetical protein
MAMVIGTLQFLYYDRNTAFNECIEHTTKKIDEVNPEFVLNIGQVVADLV